MLAKRAHIVEDTDDERLYPLDPLHRRPHGWWEVTTDLHRLCALLLQAVEASYMLRRAVHGRNCELGLLDLAVHGCPIGGEDPA